MVSLLAETVWLYLLELPLLESPLVSGLELLEERLREVQPCGRGSDRPRL